MRLFLAELRKIWNWRIILVIAVLSVGVFFTLMRPAMPTLMGSSAGLYGSYQAEMYELYGDTLEAEELAEFDIAGRIDALVSQIKELFDSHPIFHRYGIVTSEDWLAFQSELVISDSGVQLPSGDVVPLDQAMRDYGNMLSILSGHDTSGSSNGVESTGLWDDSSSVVRQVEVLKTLSQRYESPGQATAYWAADPSWVVQERIDAFSNYQNNLIEYALTTDFSLYAAFAGVLAILSVMILIAPVMTRDRATRVTALLYSSPAGRRTIYTQIAASVVSALALTVVQLGLLWMVFLGVTGSGKYWGAHIANTEVHFFMYNLTFGRYMLMLAGMITVLTFTMTLAACAMSLVSKSMINMFVKIVPITALLAIIAMVAITVALSSDNVVFSYLFRGSVPLPEIWVCPGIGGPALILATIIAIREQRIDQ